MAPIAFRHKAYNTLPAIFRGLDAIEPIEILRLFLTDSLLKTITDNTNEYASYKLAEEKRSGGRQWKEVVLEDINVGWELFFIWAFIPPHRSQSTETRRTEPSPSHSPVHESDVIRTDQTLLSCLLTKD